MNKINWYTKIGLGMITTSLLLNLLDLQQIPVASFIQGLSLGLGLVLLIKGFLVNGKVASTN